MINIGCHLSSSGGFLEMFRKCEQINANAFQYFTRNPRGGKAKEFNLEEINNFINISKGKTFKYVVAHAPYTINLCSSAEHVRKYSYELFVDDLSRVNYLPDSYYNFHPGSHTGQGVDISIEQIAQVLNKTIKKDQNTTVLLETMTGKGSEVGGKFEELGAVLKKVEFKDRIGICFDTCHVYDAGYDIVNDLEGVLEEFDKNIGISNLKVIHLNDSRNSCGSKKDRHEQIGKGSIGFEAILKIVGYKYFKDVPFILETPQESLEGYKDEIRLIKSSLEKEKI